jgi:hypothetical protein
MESFTRLLHHVSFFHFLGLRVTKSKAAHEKREESKVIFLLHARFSGSNDLLNEKDFGKNSGDEILERLDVSPISMKRETREKTGENEKEKLIKSIEKKKKEKMKERER